MSAIMKNLSKSLAKRGIQVHKLINIQRNHNGPVTKMVDIFKQTKSSHNDFCVGEGVVFYKSEEAVSQNWKRESSPVEEAKMPNNGMFDNTVKEVLINDDDSDVVCYKNYCISEGVAFYKSSVEPNQSPLFDMFDDGSTIINDVCISNGVVFYKDELKDDLPVYEKILTHDNQEGVNDHDSEEIYNEIDVQFPGKIFWCEENRAAADGDLFRTEGIFKKYEEDRIKRLNAARHRSSNFFYKVKDNLLVEQPHV